MFQEIFKGVASKVERNDRFLYQICDGIKNIFKISTNFSSHFFSALFDILLKHKASIQINPHLIASVSQESGLISTGALLIEDYILHLDDEPPKSKKGSSSHENKETVYWVKLAE